MKNLSKLLAAYLVATPILVNAQSEMRYSHFVPPTHPTFNAINEWAQSLAKATGGKLKVKVYPAEQLGKAKDHYDMVRDGIADAGWVVPGYAPGRFPIASLLELPFIAGNADGGSLAFDTWYRKFAAREMKDVYFCLGFIQDPGALHTSKKIQSPEDIKGLKLRSPTVPMSDFFRILGANSVAIPAPQVREAVERGTIDGAALAWKTAVSLGVTKATSFHLDAPVYTVPVTYLINRRFYDRQPQEIKSAIDQHCSPEWGRKVGSDWASQEIQGKQTVAQEQGHTIVSLTEQDSAKWRVAAAPLMEQWKASVKAAGEDPEKVYSSLIYLLKRHGAQY